MLSVQYTEPMDYLEEARRCEQAARECMSASNRKAYLILANQWRALARDADLHGAHPAADNDQAGSNSRVRETQPPAAD